MSVSDSEQAARWSETLFSVTFVVITIELALALAWAQLDLDKTTLRLIAISTFLFVYVAFRTFIDNVRRAYGRKRADLALRDSTLWASFGGIIVFSLTLVLVLLRVML